LFQRAVPLAIGLALASGCMDPGRGSPSEDAGEGPDASEVLVTDSAPAIGDGPDACGPMGCDTSLDGCRPRSCKSPYGDYCGVMDDGCGGKIDCGGCVGCDTCGGGGSPNTCGTVPGIINCNDPLTCKKVGANCGLITDGCGGTIDCGACIAPDTCGGGGAPSVCGHGSICIPRKACPPPAECGPYPDGCGGVINCGDPCPGMCGAWSSGSGGFPNTCPGNPFGPDLPRTCGGAGATCGQMTDGCRHLIDCGSCPTGQSCGAGGRNRCG
jgi:hypothetical protein